MYNLKTIFYLFIIYIASIIIGTSFFLSLLWTKIFMNQNVLFFRTGILLVLISIFLFFALFIIKIKLTYSKKFFLWRDIFLVVLIFFFLNWNIYGMVPFNVSRSNSIIILNYLYKNQNSPKSKRDIEAFTKHKYYEDYDAVGVRLSEQLAAGNVIVTNGNFVITKKGIITANILSRLTFFYNEKNNFLDAVPK
jgi:hypothetical protein